jgi:hypothetical protein
MKNTKILILSLFLFIGKITIFEVQLNGIPEVDDVVDPKPLENFYTEGWESGLIQRFAKPS